MKNLFNSYLTAENHPAKLTIKRWVLFTTYGWLIGIVLVVILAILCELFLKKNESGQIIVGIGMGTGVGFMQWQAIKKIIPGSIKICWFTIFGFSTSFIATYSIERLTSYRIDKAEHISEVVLLLTIFIGALISSYLQYQFLFKKYNNISSKWVLIAAIGWALAAAITISVPYLKLRELTHFPSLLLTMIVLAFITIGAPILGFFTGYCLVQNINNKPRKVNQLQ